MYRFVATLMALLAAAIPSAAQEHDHAKMLREMAAGDGWQPMQDGNVFVIFNHQSSPRGGDEVVAPNWWMGMTTRKTSRGTISFTGMLSLDPATVGSAGYRELFQTGETYHGEPNIDRQHPHDLFMQLSASWRIPLSASTSLTLTGAPVGSPALGPIAFMHRASSFDNPFAPLTHHLFDSTHVSFGMATASLERGPWTLEGSVFNGREPDEHRWDFDFGRMDAFSGRLWFKPNDQWAFQVSTGHLVHPEQYEPGDITRTTASASWTRVSGQSLDAVTAGFGRNDSTSEGVRSGGFVEASRHVAAATLFGRVEILRIDPHIAGVTAGSFTVGGVRDILNRRGLEGGVGAAITVATMPALLDAFYGAHPTGVQLFFRLRPAEHMVNMQ